MFVDALLAFVPPGAPLSLVGAAGVSFPTNPYDILGSGAGVATPNIIGNATLFGSDMGIGILQPELVVTLGTACATANSATLNVQIQGAPDTGAAGGYVPGAWTTLAETGVLAVAVLTANTRIARFKFPPPAVPQGLRIRFYRLNFAIPAGANFTAGTVANAFVTTVRDDPAELIQQPRNFTVV